MARAIRFDLIANAGRYVAGMRQAEKANVAFGMGLARTHRETQTFAKKMGRIGNIIGAGLLLAAPAIIGFGKSSVQAFRTVGMESLRLGRIMGVSVEEAGKWRGAAKLAGVPTDTFGKGMSRLATAIYKNNPALARLGIATRDSHGHLRSVAAVAVDVANKFHGMKDGTEKTALANEIFGRRLGTQLLPLLNRGGQGILDLKNKTAQLHDVIKDPTAIKQSLINQRLLNLAWEGLKVTVGAKLLPTITKFTSFLATTVVPILAKVADFVSRHTTLFGAMAAALAGVAVVMKIVAFASSAWAAGLKIAAAASKLMTIAQIALNLAMRANPIILIVTLLALLVVGIILAYKHSATFRAIVQGAFHAVAAAAIVLWHAFVTAFNGIRGALTTVISFLVALPGIIIRAFSTAGSWLLGAGRAIITGLWNGIKAAWGAVAGWFAGLGGAIGRHLAAAGSWLLGKGRDIITGLWNGIKAAWSAVTGWFAGMGAAIGRYLAAAGSWLINKGHDIITGLWNGLKAVWNSVTAWFSGMGAAVNRFLAAAGSWLVGKGHDIINGLWNGIKAIWRSVTGWFGGMASAVNRYLSGAVNWLVGKGKEIITGLWNGIKDVWRAVTGWFNGMNKAVNNYLNGAINYLVGKGKDLINGLWNGIKNIWSAVTGWFKGMNNAVNSYISGAINYLVQKGKDIINGLWNGIKAIWRSVTSWFKGMNSGINAMISGAINWIVGKGKDVITGFWNGLKSMWNTVAGWFKGLPSKILSALGIKSPPKWALDAGRHIMEGILRKLAHGAADIKGFFLGIAKSVTGPFAAIWRALMGPTLRGGSAGSGQLAQWINQALLMTGTPLNWAAAVLRRIMFESGGRVTAINRSDSNARAGHPSQGLMQVIPSTFAAYHQAGTDGILDPVANIAAAINYIKARYGSIARIDPPVRGYASGAWDVRANQLARIHRGEMILPSHVAELVRNSRGAAGGLVIAEGAVSINVANGDPNTIKRAVDESLTDFISMWNMKRRRGGRA